MNWMDSQDRCGSALLVAQKSRVQPSAIVLAHRKSSLTFEIPIKAQGISNPEKQLWICLQAQVPDVYHLYVTQLP